VKHNLTDADVTLLKDVVMRLNDDAASFVRLALNPGNTIARKRLYEMQSKRATDEAVAIFRAMEDSDALAAIQEGGAA
jgi:hypothetical protein